MKNYTPDDCIDYHEAGRLLGIGRSKLYELHAAGAIGGHAVGRARVFSRAGCLAFVEANRPRPKAPPAPAPPAAAPKRRGARTAPAPAPTPFRWLVSAE